ncbi:MAG: DNA repair protein RecO [Inhella sp.]
MVTKSPGLHAFVLHAYDWSESSLVLDVFTRERGRLAVVAKGAKRPTSQLRAVLLPMQRLHLQLAKTKADEAADIHTLRHAEWGAEHPLPAGGALLAAYYLNELLMRLLVRAQPHPVLWDAYAQTVLALSHPGQAAEPWLRAFELALLEDLGWLPALDVDSVTQAALQPGRRYALSPELGLVGSDEGVSGALWLGLQGPLTQRAELLAHSGERSLLKSALRGVLHYHLGHQPLRSRAVLHQAHDLLSS